MSSLLAAPAPPILPSHTTSGSKNTTQQHPEATFPGLPTGKFRINCRNHTVGTLSITPHCDKLPDCCQDCFLTSALKSPVSCLPLLESAKTWLKKKNPIFPNQKKSLSGFDCSHQGSKSVESWMFYCFATICAHCQSHAVWKHSAVHSVPTFRTVMLLSRPMASGLFTLSVSLKDLSCQGSESNK